MEKIDFYALLRVFRSWLRGKTGYPHINLITLLQYSHEDEDLEEIWTFVVQRWTLGDERNGNSPTDDQMSNIQKYLPERHPAWYRDTYTKDLVESRDAAWA